MDYSRMSADQIKIQQLEQERTRLAAQHAESQTEIHNLRVQCEAHADERDVEIERANKLAALNRTLVEACKESLRLCDGEDWLSDLREQLKDALKLASEGK